jgi:hypothetical protein
MIVRASPGTSSPRLDRASALGWRDVALDGLSCVLRCVEAVLRWQGLSRDEVAIALGGPVDLLRRRRDGSHYDGHVVVWESADDEHACWDRLSRALGRGTPAILVPDRFHWPGDEFEGARHFHDHAVLAVELRDDVLLVLDIDAPAAGDYMRALPVTRSLRRACARWAVVRQTGRRPPATLERFTAQVLEPSQALLALDRAELRSFGERWRTGGLDDVTAHALHVAALGDFQPVLFLFAEAACRLPDAHALTPLVELARAAARRAKSLGLLLLALHRERSSDAYELALERFDAFGDAVEELWGALASRLGEDPYAPREPAGALEARLRALGSYCFGSTPARDAG